KRYTALLILTAMHVPGTCAQTAPAAVPLEPATATEIMADIRSSDARLTVLNFWATWCAPCLEEMPAFVQTQEQFAERGVHVVFVSVDFEEDAADARDFPERIHPETVTYIKAGKDQAFVDNFDSPWTGAVPATLIFDGDGPLV